MASSRARLGRQLSAATVVITCTCAWRRNFDAYGETMRRSRRSIFTETGVALSVSQRAAAKRCAQHAALEAQESWTLTAKRQYRRYRADAGEYFMAWDERHQHYLNAYNSFKANFPQRPFGGLPPGGTGAGLYP
jgi:hypothetical protein